MDRQKTTPTPTVSQPLHTDILEQRYGAIAVVIEDQTAIVRKVHLIDAQGVSRTYAITHFLPSEWDEAVRRIAKEVRRGGSIGKTFRSHGYSIYKQPVGTVAVGLSDQLRLRMQTSQPYGALHQYIFAVQQGSSRPMPFAVITEIYPSDLAALLESQHRLMISAGASQELRYTNDYIDAVTL